MAIFDKKKKEAVKPQEKAEVKEVRKPTKKTEVDLMKVRPVPHITEKATDLTSDGQYVFKVRREATKSEIKAAIESVYRVNIVSVRVINVVKKKRRFGRTEGYKKGYKKAIVRVKEGQIIDIA